MFVFLGIFPSMLHCSCQCSLNFSSTAARLDTDPPPPTTHRREYRCFVGCLSSVSPSSILTSILFDNYNNFRQRIRVLMPEGHSAVLKDQNYNIDEPKSLLHGISHCAHQSLVAASTFLKQSMQQHNQSHQPHHTSNLSLQPPSTTLLTGNTTRTSIPMIRFHTTDPSICGRLIVNMTPSRISRSLVVSPRKARIVVIRHYISAIAAHVHDGCVIAAGPQCAEISVRRVGWAFQEVGTF